MKYEDYLVQCPYYIHEVERTVCCEGLNGGSQVCMQFMRGAGKRRHKRIFCRNKWKECPWAQTQNRIYDYTP